MPMQGLVGTSELMLGPCQICGRLLKEDNLHVQNENQTFLALIS